MATEKRKRQFHSRTYADRVLEGLDLSHRTFAITGTTSGIGVETAIALALQGAHVVMMNRNVGASEKLKNQILEKKRDAKVDIIQCDLNVLSSVDKAGKEYVEKGWPLHGLILNAGVLGPAIKTTSDGLEAHFGINHVAHFLLLQHLLPVLRRSAPSRIVILSAYLHRYSGVKPSSTIDQKLEILCPVVDSTSHF